MPSARRQPRSAAPDAVDCARRRRRSATARSAALIVAVRARFPHEFQYRAAAPTSFALSWNGRRVDHRRDRRRWRSRPPGPELAFADGDMAARACSTRAPTLKSRSPVSQRPRPMNGPKAAALHPHAATERRTLTELSGGNAGPKILRKVPLASAGMGHPRREPAGAIPRHGFAYSVVSRSVPRKG